VKAGKMTPADKTQLKLNIGKIPEILLDNTDRNRTSPFAFTGNKFEFRAVGSAANCGVPMAALNTIMAHQLHIFADAVDGRIKKGEKRDEAILKELQTCIAASKKIRFEGNGYGYEWVEEAKKRGLSNVRDTPRALALLRKKEVIDIYEKHGVLSARELEARVEIELEKYRMQIQIESRKCGDLALNHIIPTALRYQNLLIQNVQGLNSILPKASAAKAGATQLATIEEISERVEAMSKKVYEMIEARKEANKIEDVYNQAVAYCDKVKPYMEDIRYHADKLELIVDDELWPIPKLRELLFTS
ncbi:MAG: glutamine synthetase type III, partial [Flavobacteriales bacterium]|nr:glutamine synthetase type III [Flavobacteriales bacterium]